MWSSIENLKENLNKIALDVHDDDDDEELEIYNSPARNGTLVADRRTSEIDLEAFKVKQAVLLSATEAAEMILRVDEINIITCAPRRREDRM